MSSDTIEAAIVLAAYAEPVASGRRVLFIGPAVSALPARLLERGARLVMVCDPDAARLAEATAKNRSSALSFSALGEGQLALRDGAFDVCIVEDAGIAEPVGLLKKVRRALTPRGVALVACANPDAQNPLLPYRPSKVVALDYYALYDAVKSEFEHVRMLGQAPFVGYVIADFAPEGTPEPSLDTAFLPSGAEEPEIFVAVASQKPVELDAFAVVQLPYRSVIGDGAASDADDSERARAAEQSATAADAARAAEQAAAAQLRALQAELQAERRASTEQGTKLRDIETKVFARDTELAALRQELDKKQQLLRTRDGELEQLRARLEQGPSPEEAAQQASELLALEQTLGERGEHIRKLERELREAERIGKELLREKNQSSLSALEALQKTAESELGQKLAKAQADLIATRWALEAAVKKNASADHPEA